MELEVGGQPGACILLHSHTWEGYRLRQASTRLHVKSFLDLAMFMLRQHSGKILIVSMWLIQRSFFTEPVKTRRMQDPHPNCRLLQLPAELRNAIYSYALIVKTGRDARAVTYQDLLDKPDADFLELGFLRVPPLTNSCQQIRQEALPVFLGGNRFVITWNGRIPKPNPRSMAWLEIVGCHLREVSFRVDCSGAKSYVAATLSINEGKATLEVMPNVETAGGRHAQSYIDGLKSVHVCQDCHVEHAVVPAGDIITVAKIFFSTLCVRRG